MLQNTRSYAGTKTFSDHRLVNTTICINSYVLFNRTTLETMATKQFNTIQLRTDAVKVSYQNNLRTKLNDFERNGETKVQQQWDYITQAVTSAAEDVLGIQQKTKQHKRTYDPEIEKLYELQKNICMQISNCNNPVRIGQLRNKRYQTLKIRH